MPTRRMLFFIFSILMFGNFFNLQADNLRIATYNIWNPIFEEKYSGKNTWNTRLPFVVENITSSNADVLCLQEVGKEAFLDLQHHPLINSKYLSIYVSHVPKNGQPEGRDGIAFFYNSNKLTLDKFVQSHNSSRPTHRRDFYADLKLNKQSESPIHFRIASIHVDAEKDLTIGNNQLAALVQDAIQMDESSNLDFIVLCGDFNEGEDELFRPRQEIMQLAGFFTDGSTLPTRPETLNVRHKGHVDWIYFKKITPIDFELIQVHPIGDKRASDHKLTATDIAFP